MAVYWFDDTGRGRCRVPERWQLLYRDNGEWQAVKNAKSYDVKTDQFNKVKFEPITTDGLRLQVTLQPQFSAGLLEWNVE